MGLKLLGRKMDYNPRSVRMSLERATERYKNGNYPWYTKIRTSRTKKEEKELLDVKNFKESEK